MEPVFSFTAGQTPLLISIPHAGTTLPDGFNERLSSAAQTLPDTDWYLKKLYDFAGDMGASIICSNYSRYVIDLNRSADDEPLYTGPTTGLCPRIKFDGIPVYNPLHEPNEAEQKRRVDMYWQPYHQKIALTLQALRDKFGYAILFDAHSIRSEVPRLFTGKLPDLNLGTNDGKSCDKQLAKAICTLCISSTAYTSVMNGRFKGGFITRNYGRPAENIHAIQLELSQKTYMNEDPPYIWDSEKVGKIQPVLQNIIRYLTEWKPA